MSSSDLPEFIRREVASRAQFRCEYCGSSLKHSPDPFAVEHIHPRVSGGTDVLENLALECQGCNNFKATFTEARDPVSGQFSPLFHPRNHNWSEHFRWSDDYLEVIGLTPIGRATIQRLKLNREGVVNLRRLLVMIDLHPPSKI